MKKSTGKAKSQAAKGGEPKLPKVAYDPPYRTIAWKGDRVVMLDQRLLPAREKYLPLRTHAEVAQAIRDMVIRGAPAIGIAAAMGCALGAVKLREADLGRFLRAMEGICREMEQARPTAINLFWAVNRMRDVCYGRDWQDVEALREALVGECLRVHQEDVAINWQLGNQGSSVVPAGARVLTYCNTGTLATGGYGTALGVVRACVRQKKKIEVFACETRPFLQGARLTAWELMKEGIPVTLITDNAAGCLMQEGRIDCVLVGADRVAANGDVANKIGTYTVAVLCKAHKIPFYVAAPLSTVDLRCRSGIEIPIELRDPGEVVALKGKPIAPEGCRALNPAFDVTPHSLVTGIITERAVARPPYRSSLKKLRLDAGV